MLSTINNILKPHPINTRANLQKICHETNIDYEATETRSQLTTKITNFADESVSNEAIIRKLVSEVSAEGRKQKMESSSISTESNDELMEPDASQTLSQPSQLITESCCDSQAPLFDDTQEETINTQSISQMAMSQLPLFDETQKTNDKTMDKQIPGWLSFSCK